MAVDPTDLANLRTMHEAAAILHVSHSTVKRLIREKALETVRIGVGRGRVFISERALLDYANRGVQRPVTSGGRRTGGRAS